MCVCGGGGGWGGGGKCFGAAGVRKFFLLLIQIYNLKIGGRGVQGGSG